MRWDRWRWPAIVVSGALLCLWASLPGFGDEQLIIEGEIPAVLVLRGGASAVATTQLPGCTRVFSLLTVPSSHEREVEGRFERLDGGRYRFTLELGALPHGGLCGWRLSHIGFGVGHPERSSSSDMVGAWPGDRLRTWRTVRDCYARDSDREPAYCKGFDALPEPPESGRKIVELNIRLHTGWEAEPVDPDDDRHWAKGPEHVGKWVLPAMEPENRSNEEFERRIRAQLEKRFPDEEVRNLFRARMLHAYHHPDY